VGHRVLYFSSLESLAQVELSAACLMMMCQSPNLLHGGTIFLHEKLSAM
jgi:hypothetical protein